MDVVSSVDAWGVNATVANNLTKTGINSFFPVQQDVIPLLLRNNSQLCVKPRDICVSAPTGSGKTISYALPILSILQKEVTTRLRALILLPSRELAIQVNKVLVQLSEGTNVKIALVTGQRNFEEEKATLVGLTSGLGKRKANIIDDLYSNDYLYNQEITQFGKSKIDVLVCTPGRLLDHIQQTEGFTLQHLRFLVLDEADRLLGNAYQGWVRTLLQSTLSTSTNHTLSRDAIDTLFTKDNQSMVYSMKSVAPPQPLQRLLFSATLTDNPNKLALLGIYNPLLVHSTSWKANKNAEKKVNIEVDDINNGEVEEESNEEEVAEMKEANGLTFTLPDSLTESKITCETQKRPFILLSILAEVFSLQDDEEAVNVSKHKSIAHRKLCGSDTQNIVIIFTSSVEGTHRLCRLLQLANNQLDTKKSKSTSSYTFGGKVAELSRLMRADEREQTLVEATNGNVRILVSSDQMARGIDLPNIRLVINYDVPAFAKTYVHRAGRTARANKDGHCLTILKKNQDAMFQKLRDSIGGPNNDSSMLKCQLLKTSEEFVQPIYENAIQKLSIILEKENSGELSSRHND